MNSRLEADLERMVDARGVRAVLDTLIGICEAKARRFAATPDRGRIAPRWDAYALALHAAYRRIANT